MADPSPSMPPDISWRVHCSSLKTPRHRHRGRRASGRADSAGDPGQSGRGACSTRGVRSGRPGDRRRHRALRGARARTRDYYRKNGFSDVVIGLPGESIRPRRLRRGGCSRFEHVHGVAMPSRYSSDHPPQRRASARHEPRIDIRTIDRAGVLRLRVNAGAVVRWSSPGLTQENLQSRCRGQILMALSNEFGWMVLTTGNRASLPSATSRSTATRVGGYAVIKDLLKTRVYDLCRYVNARRRPRDRAGRSSTSRRQPNCVRDQRDDQSLPPYDVLDRSSPDTSSRTSPPRI